jgi:hypothetical protein
VIRETLDTSLSSAPVAQLEVDTARPSPEDRGEEGGKVDVGALISILTARAIHAPHLDRCQANGE